MGYTLFIIKGHGRRHQRIVPLHLVQLVKERILRCCLLLRCLWHRWGDSRFQLVNDYEIVFSRFREVNHLLHLEIGILCTDKLKQVLTCWQLSLTYLSSLQRNVYILTVALHEAVGIYTHRHVSHARVWFLLWLLRLLWCRIL